MVVIHSIGEASRWRHKRLPQVLLLHHLDHRRLRCGNKHLWHLPQQEQRQQQQKKVVTEPAENSPRALSQVDLTLVTLRCYEKDK